MSHPDPAFQGVLTAIETFHGLPAGERSAFYDEKIGPAAARLGALVADAPGRENVTSWLRLQAATYYFSVEGITDTTEAIRQKAPEAVAAAVEHLSPGERLRIDQLFAEWDRPQAATVGNESIEVEAFRFPWPNLFAPRAPRDEDRGPADALAEFIGTETRRSSRGHPIIHGRLTLYAADGSRLDRFEANTGGGAGSYRITNGPMPPGVYLVSHHRPNRDTVGMVLHDIGYSFDMDPTDGTDVFGRSELRIHPDGRNEGTSGCLGIREEASRLRACESAIVGLLKGRGAFKMHVRY